MVRILKNKAKILDYLIQFGLSCYDGNSISFLMVFSRNFSHSLWFFWGLQILDSEKNQVVRYDTSHFMNKIICSFQGFENCCLLATQKNVFARILKLKTFDQSSVASTFNNRMDNSNTDSFSFEFPINQLSEPLLLLIVAKEKF